MRLLKLIFFLCISFSCAVCSAGRLASFAPNITETLFALGVGDCVVAVSDFCIYPPEAMDLPRLGGKWNPNIEALAKLQPDTVFIQGEQESVVRWSRKTGVALVRVDMDSLAPIRAGIGAIAAAVARAVSGLARPSGFLALGGEAGTGGLFTAGQSFLSEILEIAGAENIFADIERAYSDVSLESLLHRQPEIVLDFRPGAAPSAMDLAGWRKLLGPDCRVLPMTQDFLLLPGPRAGLSAGELARAIHPEAGL